MSGLKRRPRPRAQQVTIDTTATGEKLVHQDGWTEYIPAHELSIDPSYQRDINHAFVAEIAETLDFAQLQTFYVARRATAPYQCEACGKDLRHRDYVLDGQHRLLGVKQRGLADVGLPCQVRNSLGSDWEADQYLRVNFKRKNPTSAARYKAAVHAGSVHGWVNDAEVQEMLDELDIPLRESTSPGGVMHHHGDLPAEIAGIGSVCRFHAAHPDLIRTVLSTMRDAWAELHATAYDSIIMAGLMDFYASHEAEADPVNVVKVLAATTPEALRDNAEQMRGNRKYPVRVCIARVVAELYNVNRRTVNRVREIAPAQYVSSLRARTQKRSGHYVTSGERLTAFQAGLKPEERSEIARKGVASTTPEQRSERSQRGHATRRAKGS
jgi:hypothetical protein